MMLKRLMTGLLLLSSASYLWAASPITLYLQTSANANVNEVKQASPLPVTVFLLAGSKQFNKAGYFSLEENASSSLGAEYVTKRSIILLPNSNNTVSFPNDSGAYYLGVIAGYNNLQGKQWRKVIKVSDLSGQNAVLRFSSTGITARYIERADTAKNRVYVEGSLGYGLLSTTTEPYAYSTNNTAVLNVNQQSQNGQAGASVGYQWQRGSNNWLNSLHLEKVSLGVGFSYAPFMKFDGHVLDHVNNPVQQQSRNFDLSASAQQLFVEGKVNFFRIKSFTTFVNAAAGIVQYKNTFNRQSSDPSYTVTTEYNNSSMFYALGAGFEYDVNDNVSLSLGYQYNSPTTLKIEEETDTSGSVASSPSLTINNNVVLFKIRYLVD